MLRSGSGRTRSQRYDRRCPENRELVRACPALVRGQFARQDTSDDDEGRLDPRAVDGRATDGEFECGDKDAREPVSRNMIAESGASGASVHVWHHFC